MAVIKAQKNKKNESRLRRHARVRATISGTAERPRLAVFKSNRYIYAQVIDDIKGVTICQASSLKDTKGTMTDQAKKVGVAVAKEALGKKVNEVVFDRGGFRFTGRVAALAEAAREGGLKF